MEFLKRFFNDDSTIVGLCGFEGVKSKNVKRLSSSGFCLNNFQSEKVFETNVRENVLLF